MFTKRNRWLIGATAGVLVAGCTSGGLYSAANKVLAAKLGAAGGAQAYVEFDDDDGEFEVDVSGGAPGATVEVSINGVVVLSVTLDEFGNAHLEFDSDPDDADESQLPPEFSEPAAGDDVEVGELSGAFEEDEEDETDDEDDDEDDDDEDDDDADEEDDELDD